MMSRNLGTVSPEFEVKLLVPDEAHILIALRKEALETNPLAFGASLEDDKTLSPEFLRNSLADPQASVIVGLFDGVQLVGMVGVVRDGKVKRRHRVGIWGMYVS